MRRRTLLVGALVALVGGIVAVALVVVLGGDDGDGRGARTGELLEPPVRVQPERDEALALIRRGLEGTYHARYEATGDPGALPGSVEVWRKGGWTRTDMRYEAEGAVQLSASIRRPVEAGGPVACRREGDGPWSCERVDAPHSDLLDEAATDLAGEEIEASDAQVGGRAARCFSVVGNEPMALCLDRDGVLLRLTAGPGVLELASLDTAVDQSVFQPPAPVA